jgi:hypothetical protein
VHRARQRIARRRDHRSLADHQHLICDQRLRDCRSGAGENPCERGARHAHPLGGRLLVQALEVGETQRLQLVEPEVLDDETVDGLTDRLECSFAADATDPAGFLGSGHRTSISSICSKLTNVKAGSTPYAAGRSGVQVEWRHALVAGQRITGLDRMTAPGSNA